MRYYQPIKTPRSETQQRSFPRIHLRNISVVDRELDNDKEMGSSIQSRTASSRVHPEARKVHPRPSSRSTRDRLCAERQDVSRADDDPVDRADDSRYRAHLSLSAQQNVSHIQQEEATEWHFDIYVYGLPWSGRYYRHHCIVSKYRAEAPFVAGSQRVRELHVDDVNLGFGGPSACGSCNRRHSGPGPRGSLGRDDGAIEESWGGGLATLGESNGRYNRAGRWPVDAGVDVNQIGWPDERR
ncbi:uncharacterized protein CLUP02_06326 [Colletotrichum lupini]|uniref:Uncharacterized protein n=1 Tax=Colletotrichum lupini TaxID=145971 RepID=A0A9Q8WF06_9PEZI|nr:uncharacterized protein CLUP02_06326 [Colletotrichum lupini]UQC80841.1 hypothetical protein CLUP02_06326 [Colletotrichum lupini]